MDQKMKQPRAVRAPKGTGTRDRMLDAAADVMRKVGVVRATTKAIASAAGFSEAALYRHFKDKDDIFFHVLTERLPTFAGGRLAPQDRGSRSIEQQLIGVAIAALRFYSESMPIAVSLLSDPEALARNRTRMVESGRGPQRANQTLANYLKAEQQAGRIATHVNLSAASTLLIGACFQRVFLSIYHGEIMSPRSVNREASAIVKTLLRGIAPASEPSKPRLAARTASVESPD